jgi:hypothetical protein
MDADKIGDINRERLYPELHPVLGMQRTLVIGYKNNVEALARGKVFLQDGERRFEVFETV